ncbi:hypothetical protein CASFOL_000851 [Castilleja foliolosa]|uniref:3'-5' exonuclease domain-containing protein n=1 Tax=Castilleja foliolosa TaxID=1961234 RepID=A0ABD3EKV7_9LAMI
MGYDIRIEKYDLPSIADKHKLYRVFVDEENEIETLVTHHASVVELWIDKNIEEVFSRLRSLIVGLGVQWRPKSDPVATLQLSFGKYCLIYQILESGNRIPYRLRAFLGNPRYLFVGVGVQNNVNRLRAYCGLKVANIRELSSWAASKLDRKGLGKAGLKLLVKEILGVEMKRPKNIKLSLWDNPELSLHQVAYASLDAYFSFEIGISLSASSVAIEMMFVSDNNYYTIDHLFRTYLIMGHYSSFEIPKDTCILAKGSNKSNPVWSTL